MVIEIIKEMADLSAKAEVAKKFGFVSIFTNKYDEKMIEVYTEEYKRVAEQLKYALLLDIEQEAKCLESE